MGSFVSSPAFWYPIPKKKRTYFENKDVNHALLVLVSSGALLPSSCSLNSLGTSNNTNNVYEGTIRYLITLSPTYRVALKSASMRKSSISTFT